MKKLLSFLATLPVILIVMTSEVSASFKDVPANHPYREAIDYVQSQGIVSGYPDGTFQMDRALNRAEFTKFVVSSRKDSSQIDTCVNSDTFYKKKIFSDIEPGVWFEKYFCVAKLEKIIAGYPDGTSRPTQGIIFAEAAKILVNSYGFEVPAGDPWFIPYIEKLKALKGIPQTLASIRDPIQQGTKPITRGEIAAMIFLLKDIRDTVSSPDGKFSLRIPQKSLPPGVDLSSISVRALPRDQNPVEEVNGAPMVFYTLEPDGLTFNEPIDFQITTPTLMNTIPMVFLVSGDSFDMIPEPAIEIDQERQQAVLSGQLAHFSSLGMAFISLYQVSLVPLGTQTVGVPFTAKANFTYTGFPNTFTRVGTTDSIIITDATLLRGTFVGVAPVSDVPRSQVLTTGTQTYTADLTCPNAGSEDLHYQADLRLSYRHGTKDSSVTLTVASLPMNFTCLSEPTVKLADPDRLSCRGAQLLDPPSGMAMKVMKLPNGECIPLYQKQGVAEFPADVCAENNYHTYSFEDVTLLSGSTLRDPDVAPKVSITPGYPTECGFGKVSDVKKGTIYVQPAQFNFFNNL
jgi:hypothetical protein